MQEKGLAFYRHDRKLLWTGILCTAGFLFLGIFSFVGAYWNPDGSFLNPKATACFLAAFWTGFTGLGV